jgi:hypothetical protein
MFLWVTKKFQAVKISHPPTVHLKVDLRILLIESRQQLDPQYCLFY